MSLLPTSNKVAHARATESVMVPGPEKRENVRCPNSSAKEFIPKYESGTCDCNGSDDPDCEQPPASLFRLRAPSPAKQSTNKAFQQAIGLGAGHVRARLHELHPLSSRLGGFRIRNRVVISIPWLMFGTCTSQSPLLGVVERLRDHHQLAIPPPVVADHVDVVAQPAGILAPSNPAERHALESPRHRVATMAPRRNN